MRQYLIRRLVQSFFLLWVVTALFFLFLRLAPGGPEAFLVDPRMTESDKRALLEDWGLTDPIPIQYVRWLEHLVKGDLGRSFQDRRPVWDKIVERIPNSLYLNVAGLLIGFLGVPLGIWAATNHRRLPDHLTRIFTVIMSSMPLWWIGLMLLLLFASVLRLVPMGGLYTIGQDSLANRLWHLALPATVSGIAGWVGYSRLVRSEMLEVLSQDYVRTARAKGLSEREVRFRHALRNSLIPVATGIGPTITTLIGGSVIFERVFSWPGLGRLGYDAAIQRDFPLTMGLFFVFTILIMIGYLISDIAYAVLDPRVRFN